MEKLIDILVALSPYALLGLTWLVWVMQDHTRADVFVDNLYFLFLGEGE